MDETEPLREEQRYNQLMASSTADSATSQDEALLGSRFECNICLDDVREPIVTQCGHLYCWSCLYRWLNTNHSTCPLCKAGVTRDNVIPLFIRGVSTDPRSRIPEGDVPSRPNAHRPAVNNLGLLGGQNFPGGNDMNSGFGFFPSLFGLQFQSYAVHPQRPAGRPPTAEETMQETLTRILLGLGCFVVLCLLIF